MVKKYIAAIAMTLVIFVAGSATAFATDTGWKFKGWAHTENTTGETYLGDAHEYVMEARLTVSKQIRDNLGFTYQLSSKSWLDEGDTKVNTRLAYFTWKPNKDTTIVMGKNAYWLAGGLLMDDYLRGVSVDVKLNDRTNFFGMLGRHEGDTKKVVGAASINATLGSSVDLGLHYIGGNKAMNSDDKGGKIWAVTTNLASAAGVNFGIGYAKNAEADDNNTTWKVQASKKINKTDVILQYWRQEGKMGWPVETGNHMAFWGDMYGSQRLDGMKGYRLIIDHPIAENTNFVLAYGNYKGITNPDKTANKLTGEVYISF